MSVLKVAEQDLEAGLVAIGTFIEDDVWPVLKSFLTLFSPAEAKSLLADIVGAVPTAESSGVGAAAAQIGAEIVPQTEANAINAAEAILNKPAA